MIKPTLRLLKGIIMWVFVDDVGYCQHIGDFPNIRSQLDLTLFDVGVPYGIQLDYRLLKDTPWP